MLNPKFYSSGFITNYNNCKLQLVWVAKSTTSSCEWSGSNEASAWVAMSASSSCEWSDSDEASVSSCTGQIQQAWSRDDTSILTNYPQVNLSLGGKETPSPQEEFVSLLDCSISPEVSWTHPPKPQKNATRSSPRVPKANIKYNLIASSPV